MILALVFLIFLTIQRYAFGKTLSPECEHVVELAGAGGEFSSAVYQTLGSTYSTNRSAIRKVHFSYEKVNSAYGIERITLQHRNLLPAVFAGVEITLDQKEKETFPNLVTFPILAGAMVIMFNIPHVNAINITLSTVADIYLGNVTYWNDKAIQSVNPDIALPEKKILPVARTDHCGETFIFTTGLSRVSSRWNKLYGIFSDPLFEGGKCCNSTKWSSNAVSYFGNRAVGMVGVVSSVPYTIGYAAYSNTIEGTDVKFAGLINRFGKVVQPTMESIQLAMDYVLKNEENETTRAHLEYNINNVPLSDAYPFASFSYMIVNRSTHHNVTCCQMEELTGFVDVLYNPDVRDAINQRGLVQISVAFADYLRRNVISKIRCRGDLVYERYKETLVRSTDLSEHEKVVIGVASVFGILGLIIGLAFTYMYVRNKILNENLWFLKDIRIIMSRSAESDFLTLSTGLSTLKHESLSTVSDDSGKSEQTMNGHFHKGFSVQSETDVLLTEFDSTNGLKFEGKTKKMLLKFLREVQHANLFQFSGVAFINKKLYLINQHTSLKGTLHYVLEICPYNIDINTKCNFAKDIINGLKFLHQKRLAHGTLTSLDCFLTTNWLVKIASWELMNIYLSENDFINLSSQVDYVPSTVGTAPESEEALIKLLYKDPDYLKVPKEGAAYQSDVYSMGVLFIEIFTRKLPYFREVELGVTTYPNIIANKFERFIFWPDLKTDDVPMDMQNLLKKFLARLDQRPDIVEASKLAKPLITNEKGIIDLLMVSVENYTNQLQDKLAELTAVTGRMKDLLYDVLPPQIAEKLFRGENIEPEFYECCTIFFSDIVGFTNIAAQSTPIQVMRFLNDIYVKFDCIIEQFDVYKVDTIGDAYMVASGLPVQNGVNHCKCIGLMALDLLKKISDYKIAHLNGDKLKLRMGINSGPVTAGIIGRKMPQ